MKISGACLRSLVCGACERELPEGSYSEEQRARRQSIRRCEECVASGNQLVLMKKGRTRSEADDCPICQLPLPLDMNESLFRECCMKRVCNGCVFAAGKRGMWDCPFCRTHTSEEEQALAMIQARVDKGDPMAIYNLGTAYDSGEYGLERDVPRAVELYERAAELGVKEAHNNLGVLYDMGTEVEKDMDKAIRHYETSAMCGNVEARYNLGVMEFEAGNYDLGLQHFLISAKMGHDDSLRNVKGLFMKGLATKADYAAALRGYQNAIEEMKSPDRDQARERTQSIINRTPYSALTTQGIPPAPPPVPTTRPPLHALRHSLYRLRRSSAVPRAGRGRVRPGDAPRWSPGMTAAALRPVGPPAPPVAEPRRRRRRAGTGPTTGRDEADDWKDGADNRPAASAP
ncbi:hypothetical protein THAOC_32905 [Thalassiosira oceanica]|uniref:RING-type domain-containing protein n=1 Tax=Thalassiosira oceanica TaxID=159749 RepID=K0R690_THAOC|nr:hypothetical protein THAOC_32905 [Thalassiosira oceanica]|eukprot:EJK48310.1 hypothetical protein THAOC_32905 [Thalassiosira oceanica]